MIDVKPRGEQLATCLNALKVSARLNPLTISLQATTKIWAWAGQCTASERGAGEDGRDHGAMAVLETP